MRFLTFGLQDLRRLSLKRKTVSGRFLSTQTESFKDKRTQTIDKSTLAERETLLWVQKVVVGLRLCPWAGAVLKDRSIRIKEISTGHVERSLGSDLEGKDKGKDEEHSSLEAVVLQEIFSLITPQNRGGDRVENQNKNDNSQIHSTTLLVLTAPDLCDFDSFLSFTMRMEDILSDTGLDTHVQLATFHPDYQFEGEGDEGGLVTNYTNRSPRPVLHLLKTADVQQAIEKYSDQYASQQQQQKISNVEERSRSSSSTSATAAAGAGAGASAGASTDQIWKHNQKLLRKLGTDYMIRLLGDVRREAAAAVPTSAAASAAAAAAAGGRRS